LSFLPNGQDPALGEAFVFEYQVVANYLYILLAFVFVFTTVGTAIGVRLWLYQRRMRARRRAALGAAAGSGEKQPLLAGLMSDAEFEQIDVDEIQLSERIGKGTYGEVYRGVWRGTVVAVKKVPHRAFV
jgi:hypothetical protein